jgi:hypothetical protein
VHYSGNALTADGRPTAGGSFMSEGVREIVSFVHTSLVLREFARGPLPSRMFSVDNAFLFQYLLQVSWERGGWTG